MKKCFCVLVTLIVERPVLQHSPNMYINQINLPEKHISTDVPVQLTGVKVSSIMIRCM